MKISPENGNDYEAFCEKIAPIRGEDLTKTLEPMQSLPKRLNKRKFYRYVEEFYAEMVRSGSKSAKPTISNIDDLLKQPFIVGEQHESVFSKKFLIDNMEMLKNAGFTTLFIEHLFYDEDQILLDLAYKEKTLSPALKKRLAALDHMFKLGHTFIEHRGDEEWLKENWAKYNFTTLVDAAIKAGIRVVGIDIGPVYRSQDKSGIQRELSGGREQRYKDMNYTSYKIIDRECLKHPGNWLALVGSGHVNLREGVPGLADLFAVPAVYVADQPSSSKEKANVIYNGSYKIAREMIRGDMIIVTKPDESLPQFIKPSKPITKLRL